MNLPSRTILMGILVLARRSLTAPQIIRLAKPLGLSSSNAKSLLTRLVAEAALKRNGRPRLATYEPSNSHLTVINGIHARLNENPDPRWDGTWLMLTLRLPADRSLRAQRRASLWFDGFRPIAADTFVRPAWPLPWAMERASDRLATLDSHGFCLRGKWMAVSCPPTELYDLDGLNRDATRLACWIEARTRSLNSRKAAYIARMQIGGRVAQFIGHDPRLPGALWGKRKGMRQVVESFRRFERRVAPRSQAFIENEIAAEGDGPRNTRTTRKR